MRKPWIRLVSLFRIRDEQQMNYIFQKHHQFADEMITDTYGNVMAAVYFTPTAKNKEHTKAIFKEIQKRTHFACEVIK